MKHQLFTPIVRPLLTLLMGASLVLSLPVASAPVVLATSPLATSSSSSVSPNIMFMLDDSGSMDWDYMPDNSKNFNNANTTSNVGKYGFNSSHCNGVAYNPKITYSPPVDSTGVSYPNSNFTAAWDDGYATGAGTTDLSASFTGGSGTGASGSTLSPVPAFYYTYSGTQTQAWQENFYDATTTFYKECNSQIGSTLGSAVFTKVIVSATSGPAGSDERTNFANWFSYYSTRMQMMKTGVGLAFKSVNPSFRVGFMTMNNNVSPDFVDILPFASTQKSNWYSKLYGANPGQSTPLRQALSQIGQLYANKFSPTTVYTATITVSGSTTTSTVVSSILEGPSGCTLAAGTCVELMATTSSKPSSKGINTSIAKNVAGQINAVNSPIYSATASSNVVTITGGASDLGNTPIVTSSGGGTFTASKFIATTVSQKLNGVVPLDPVQYSCQKNFVILSTDGYWNGNAGYKLDGSAIGNQDGSAARPYYDGSTVTQTTSQVAMTQAQMAKSTSQLIQPYQSRTSNLISTSYALQKTTYPLIKTSNPLQQTATPLIKTSNPLQKSAYPLIKTSNPLQKSAYPLIKTSNPLQKSAYPLIKTSYPLQQSAWQLQKSTDGGTTWSNAGSCKVNTATTTTCRYAATPTITTVTSCTVSAKTVSTANGTTYNASATDCAYATTGATVTNPAGSCTVVNSPGPTNYSGPQVLCSYGTPAVSTVTTCTTSAPSSGSTNNTVYNASAED
jgi:hypothetical protein